MKTCRTCRVEKPLSDFYANHRMPDGKLNHCKDCFREMHREARATRAKENRKYLSDIKLARGCADCGYNKRAEALDFDHLPEHGKTYRMCTMAEMRRELIDAEIAKCEVVCANCHRIRTVDRLRALGQDPDVADA